MSNCILAACCLVISISGSVFAAENHACEALLIARDVNFKEFQHIKGPLDLAKIKHETEAQIFATTLDGRHLTLSKQEIDRGRGKELQQFFQFLSLGAAGRFVQFYGENLFLIQSLPRDLPQTGDFVFFHDAQMFAELKQLLKAGVMIFLSAGESRFGPGVTTLTNSGVAEIRSIVPDSAKTKQVLFVVPSMTYSNLRHELVHLEDHRDGTLEALDAQFMRMADQGIMPRKEAYFLIMSIMEQRAYAKEQAFLKRLQKEGIMVPHFPPSFSVGEASVRWSTSEDFAIYTLGYLPQNFSILYRKEALEILTKLENQYPLVFEQVKAVLQKYEVPSSEITLGSGWHR